MFKIRNILKAYLVWGKAFCFRTLRLWSLEFVERKLHLVSDFDIRIFFIRFVPRRFEAKLRYTS
jgi:hypothetical protein